MQRQASERSIQANGRPIAPGGGDLDCQRMPGAAWAWYAGMIPISPFGLGKSL